MKRITIVATREMKAKTWNTKQINKNKQTNKMKPKQTNENEDFLNARQV